MLGVREMTLAAQTRTFVLWARALCLWLNEPRHFWLAIVVVGAALIFSLRRGATEPEIRITGLILQILGVGTVAWGIRETRVLFGHPTLVDQFRAWRRRFPVYGGRTVFGSGNVAMKPASLHARGYTLASAGLNPTTETRVDALEKNVKLIHERIDHTQSEMDQKFRSHASLLEWEAQTRARDDQALREKLEVTETGGLHISAMGALWLFIGITLSTAAPEIAKWLN